ncbi:MAG: hypothetical protein AB8F94_16295 [Saprospiraceae bacterium]
MPHRFLETQINFSKQNSNLFPGEVGKGEIILQPKIDLEVHLFGFHVAMEGRGQTAVITKSINKTILIQDVKLLKGETYRYDIEIIGALPPSYAGENISLYWRVETFIELQGESYNQVRNSLLKKFQLLAAVNPNKKLSTFKSVYFKTPDVPYSVNPTPSVLNLTGFSPEKIGSAFMLFSFFSLWLFDSPYNFGAIILFAIVLLFSFVVPYYYKARILGKIEFIANTTNNNQLSLNFILPDERKRISKLKVQYKIVEKVIDDRGTNTTTYHYNIFKSTTKEKRSPEKTTEFIFDFPNRNTNTMISFEIGNLSFYWEVNVVIEFDYGGESTFAQKIFVEQKDMNWNPSI